jgi:hypothetical protein
MIIGNILRLIRNISHIVFSLILVMITAGMTITRHYCGTRLVSVNIISEPEKCCDNSNCCHSETITIKLDSDILNEVPDYSFRIFSSSAPLAHESIFNDNPLLLDNYSFIRILTTGIIGFFNLPPPELSTILSKLETFLL